VTAFTGDRSFKFKKVLFRSLALPLLLALFLAELLLWQLSHSRRAAAWAQHTDTLIAEAHQEHYRVREAQAQVWGYLLVGDQLFLERFRSSLTAMERGIDELADIVVDHPAQEARVSEEIASAVERWKEVAHHQVRRAPPHGGVRGLGFRRSGGDPGQGPRHRYRHRGP
jgi:CHASE3 domain sensor protein